VLAGSLSDEHFAADLDHIVRDPGSYPVYGNPEDFFALTHPTKGLKDLLARTFGRISGAKGIPGTEKGVLRPQTSFGGGKTHGLIALYHLATGARPTTLDKFVDPKLLPATCRIAATVGDKFEPVAGIETRLGDTGETVTTLTLWGDLAAQLGAHAWDAMKAADGARSAPGSDTWARAIGDIPTIIVIDEIVQHMRQCATSGDEDVRRQAQAIPVFLKALFQHAAATPHVVVVVSLATHADAYGKETTELEKLLDEHLEAADEAAADAQSVLARQQTIIRPAEDSEIAEILKTRLFAKIDAKAADETASVYRDLYESVSGEGIALPDGADTPAAYADRVGSSYPFHPELVRVLDKRIGTLPNFQRARGALRLLAEVVAALWTDGTDAPTLNVADVDLRAGNVLTNLTTGLGRDAYEPAARADITDPGSHAAAVDKERFAGKAPYATRAATCVFLNSLEQLSSAGAGRSEYLLGTLRPGDSPEVIDEALKTLAERAWHLTWDGTRFVVRTEANANAVIAGEARNLSPALVADEVRDRIEKAFKSYGGYKAVLFPAGPGSVADSPELQVVILDHEDTSVTDKTALPPPNRAQEIRSHKGAANDFRTYRNGVAFLAGDTDQIQPLKDRVRKHLAIRKILDSDDRVGQLGEEVIRRIRELEKTALLDVRVAISRCYCHLYYSTKDAKNADLRHFELPVSRKGNVDDNQVKAVIDTLQTEGKIRTDKIGYDYLRSKAWPKDAVEVATDDLADAFWRDHGAAIVEWTFIADAIRNGVKASEWVYYDADDERVWGPDDPAPNPQRKASSLLYLPARAKELGLLRPDLKADDIIAIVGTKKTLGGSDLRAALENLLGWEPKKTAITEILSRIASGPTSPLIVVEGDPNGAKPLPKSDIEKTSLDKLIILTRAEAEAAGVDLDAASGPKTLKAVGKGLAGPAFNSANNKAQEANGAGIVRVSVTATADPGEKITDFRRLGIVLGQLPKPSVTVSIQLDLDFGSLGDTEIALHGPKVDYQALEDKFLAFANTAQEADGAMTITVTWDEPIPVDGTEWHNLHKLVQTADPGEIVVTAEVLR
jgi:hypothetical protein